MKNKRVLSLLLPLIFILAACQSAPTTLVPQPTLEDSTPTSSAAQPTVEPAPTETSGPSPTSTQPPAVFEPVVTLAEVASGLTAPVALAAPEDGSGRRFIVDQIGLIHILDGDNQLLPTPFLDLRERMASLNSNYDERGLLGLAFHPNYATSGRLFVYYSAPLRPGAPAGWDHTNVLSEFAVDRVNVNLADPASEKIILQVDQPQSNHNAGAIAFGPEGYLYIPLGDGGGGNDNAAGHAEDWYAQNGGGNGQDTEANLLGSVLRIDIDNGDPYSVPADNPALSQTYPEIWAFGFRNPYRMAFDPGGEHALFLGDAGQELWEEVSIVTAGGNYGWNVREGTHCFSTAAPGTPDAITDCPTEDANGNPLIAPIIEFPNVKHPSGGLGTTIIGGVVYRGTTLPGWDGKYIFGQWSMGFSTPQGGIFVATRPTDESASLWDFEAVQIANHEDGELGTFLLAIGQDAEGEVYLLTSGLTGPNGTTGKVFQLAPPSTN